MRTKLPERYQACARRTEAISLLTAWVRQLKPFGRCPQLSLAARIASNAIDMANLFDMDPDNALASEIWEFHTRAYLLVMLVDFYSIVDAVAKTLDTKNIALTPSQLRKVCERAAIRALMSARESDLRADLYRSSFGHACHILEKRRRRLELIPRFNRNGAGFGASESASAGVGFDSKHRTGTAEAMPFHIAERREPPGPETLRGEFSLKSVAALASTMYFKESPMLAPQAKQQVVVKLVGARDELENALRLTAPSARYDPIVIPQALRNEVSVMRDDLDRMIHMLEKTQ